MIKKNVQKIRELFGGRLRNVLVSLLFCTLAAICLTLIVVADLPSTTIVLLCALMLLFSMQAFEEMFFARRFYGDIGKRISSVKQEFQSLVDEVSAIEELLTKKIGEFDVMKKEALNSQEIASLTEDQAKALEASVEKLINGKKKLDLFITFLISLFFFLLGLIGPSILRLLATGFL